MVAQIIGYVVGGLLTALAIFLIVKNIIDVVKAVKQRKKKKDNEMDCSEENKVS